MIYELKVTLDDVGVPVWRKIQVDGRTSFLELHQILQVCFEWEGYHLHQFDVRKTNGKKVENAVIQSNEEESISLGLFDMHEAYDEKQETVADWFEMRNDNITYTYDFGDSWEHNIVLTKKIKPENNVQYPRCIEAKNYAPDEDSRGEILMGEVDLECADSSKLLKEINLELKEYAFDTNDGTKEDQIQMDFWEEVLLKSKEFLKIKPWEKMDDNHIFSVIDPVTNEQLFCSVMGAGGEVYGLAVYIGKDGYRALKHIFKEQDDNFNLMAHQRSIVLSFEDREDLEKEEYSLIKSYDIPFRGRKSWPSFRSYLPGYYPWLMDEEEARIMLLALEQTLELYKEIKAGLEVPDFAAEEKVYTKVPYSSKGSMIFKNEAVDLKGFIEKEDEAPVEIAVSPFELKKLEKLKKADASIEFFVNYVNLPVQEGGGERPVFPVLVLAVDHKGQLIVYQNLNAEELNAELIQRELLRIFQNSGGIPHTLFMDLKTARMIEPLTKRLTLNVQTNDYPPIARMVVEEMENQLPF